MVCGLVISQRGSPGKYTLGQQLVTPHSSQLDGLVVTADMLSLTFNALKTTDRSDFFGSYSLILPLHTYIGSIFAVLPGREKQNVCKDLLDDPRMSSTSRN